MRINRYTLRASGRASGRVPVLCAVVVPVILLGACSPENGVVPAGAASSASSTATLTEQFPRTVTVGAEEVVLQARPARIAVLSPDAASLVTRLVPAESIAMITDQGEDNPDGPVIVPGSASVDPEQVLSVNPDLVIVTARHGQEKDAGSVLRDSGVPVAEFPSSDWSGIDDLLANLEILGQLTGTGATARELRDRIEEDRRKVADRTDTGAGAGAGTASAKPRVLTLMARGGQRMIMPPTTMMNGLVREAGGTVIADETGNRGSAPADPEVVARLNPDVILVEDFRGQGERDFSDLLSDPALADVSAVKERRIDYLPTGTTGVSAGVRIGEGLRAVADAVSPPSPR